MRQLSKLQYRRPRGADDRASAGRSVAKRQGRKSIGSLCGAAMLAVMLAGCSMSMPIGQLKEKDEGLTTGSISAAKPAANLSNLLGEEDWRRAQAALGVAVDPQGNGAPVSWDNPESGRKGSFVAAGPLYILENKVCRSFLATIDVPDTSGVDQKLHGASCRNGPNDWSVRETTPWKG